MTDKSPSYTETAAAWFSGLRYEDLPPAVVHSTKRLILNAFAIAIAAAKSDDYGRVATGSCIGEPGPCQVLGTDTRTTARSAALANGMLLSCLGFDDSLPETLIHVSAATVSCALALAQSRPTTGREFLTAIAGGNEMVCRIGLVAPLAFHPNGLHPSGIIGAMGTAFLAARLSGLSGDRMRDAVGITGNMASGINQSWVDGTHAQFVDSGWAAAAGITASRFAMAGMSGPAQVLEGRFGLFRGYVQDPSVHLNFPRMVESLGQHWNALDIEMKRYPTGHVNLPFVEAMEQLHDLDGVRASDVSKITALVAKWMMPVVCDPVAEKRRPQSDLHGRVSLPYTLAETLIRGRLGAGSYSRADLVDPEILALADKTDCIEDVNAPSSAVYKGAVTVELKDGRRFERVVLHGKGLGFPDELLRAKLEDCLSYAGHADSVQRLWDGVLHLEDAPDMSSLGKCLETLH